MYFEGTKVTTLLTKFLKTYKYSIDLGATDLHLAPVFKGKTVVLTYTRGRLTTDFDQATLTRSRIRDNFFEGLTSGGTLGLQQMKKFDLVCTLSSYDERDWLLVNEVTRHGGEPLPSSLPIQLHVLRSRRFLTGLSLCSWASVTGVSKDGSAKTRVLPTTKAEATELYEDRLRLTRKVLAGKAVSYWQPSMKSLLGRTTLPATVTGLRITASTGKPSTYRTYSFLNM